jgi:hypothetical protein
MASGEMSQAEFVGFLEQALGHHVAHSVNGAIHFVCMDWRHLGELLAAGRSLYSEFKNLCVWEKTNAGMGSLYRSQHELVAVFKVGTAPHVNNIELGRYGSIGDSGWVLAQRPGMDVMASSLGGPVGGREAQNSGTQEATCSRMRSSDTSRTTS